MNSKSYTEIYESMRNYIIAACNKITDFNDGSVVSSLLEAVAREIFSLYIRCRVGFSQYLAGLPYSVFGLAQKDGVCASGYVVFSRSAPLGVTTVIPQDTVVQSGTRRFRTVQAGSILPGETESGRVAVLAETAGSGCNVNENTVTEIVSVLSGDVVSVTNPERIAGGGDREKTNEFAERFQAHMLGLQGTNYYGIKSAVLGIESVRSCVLIEHFPPLNDQGALFNFTIYADDGTGNCSDSVKEKIRLLVDGDGTAQYMGRRAPGINYRVLEPVIKNIDYRIAITVGNCDRALEAAKVQEAVKNYTNSLKLGESLVLTSVIALVRSLSNVKDVAIEFPDANVDVADYMIIRCSGCDVAVSEGS